MACLVFPVGILKRRSSRLGYEPLLEGCCGGDPVTVVVGKEKREFLVEAFVLEENPFRVLIDSLNVKVIREKRVIYVDVDAILFEHMLWLMYNDSSSLFNLNVKEIIDFYAQDC